MPCFLPELANMTSLGKKVIIGHFQMFSVTITYRIRITVTPTHRSIAGSICCWRPFCIRHYELWNMRMWNWRIYLGVYIWRWFFCQVITDLFGVSVITYVNKSYDLATLLNISIYTPNMTYTSTLAKSEYWPKSIFWSVGQLRKKGTTFFDE
jgi:hypothetical protein